MYNYFGFCPLVAKIGTVATKINRFRALAILYLHTKFEGNRLRTAPCSVDKKISTDVAGAANVPDADADARRSQIHSIPRTSFGGYNYNLSTK